MTNVISLKNYEADFCENLAAVVDDYGRTDEEIDKIEAEIVRLAIKKGILEFKQLALKTNLLEHFSIWGRIVGNDYVIEENFILIKKRKSK